MEAVSGTGASVCRRTVLPFGALPVSSKIADRIQRSTRYLMSIEARIEILGANSSLLGRLYYDHADTFAEVSAEDLDSFRAQSAIERQLRHPLARHD